MKQSLLVRALRAQMGVGLASGLAALVAMPVQAEPLMDADGFEIEIPVQTYRDVTFTSSYEFGLGYTSDAGVKFGEYNSLEEQGLNLIGNVDLLLREPYDGDENAPYLALTARNLGTFSREVEAIYGRQGDYRLTLSLDQTEKQYSASYLTPYADAGSDSLSLPTGWSNLACSGRGCSWDDTQWAALLDNNLPLMDSYPLSARRDSYAIGYQKSLGADWSVKANVNREYKQGAKDYGFYVGTPLILPEPIDYRTDQLNLGVEHATKRYQYQLNYYLSQFDNKYQALEVESAANGSTSAFALPPSNDYQQLSLNSNFRLTDATRATLYLAYGRGSQSEELDELLQLDTSLNLGAPYDDAPVEVDVTRDSKIVQLGLSSRVARVLTLSGKFRYEDKDVDVDDLTYRWAASSRGDKIAQMLDFDQTRRRLNLDAGIRLPRSSKLKLGVEVDSLERTNVDQAETREKTYSVTYKLPKMGPVLASVDFSRSDREGQEDYNPDASKETIHVDGTSFRRNAAGSQKYNYADRERDRYGLSLSLPVSRTVQLGASLKAIDDSYDEATYGLQSTDNRMYSVDLVYAPNVTTSATLYAGVQKIDFVQKADGGTYDWLLDSEDSAKLAGVDLKVNVIPNRLDLNVGYRYSRSVAAISHRIGDVDAGSTAPTVTALPDLETRIHTFDLVAEYHLDAQSTLKVQYLYENYDSQNWATDNLTAFGTQTTTYLAGGIESPNHQLHYVGLTYKRAF